MNDFHSAQKVLRTAVQAGLNVLIEGAHGQGKTALVAVVTGETQLRTAYFSASTLDPFADLVGLPMPVAENGEYRRVVYLRPESVTNAQVMFFDELNRAHPKVLNAVFELIQFRSINGDRLGSLRNVVAAINPPDAGNHAQELEPALLDRFHVFISLLTPPQAHWFEARFGSKLGKALVDWHMTDLDEAQRALVTNRRLE